MDGQEPHIIGKAAFGHWFDMGDLRGDGSRVRIRFDAGGVTVQRHLDPRIYRAVIEEARHSRDIHKQGTLLRGTQKHWRPAFVLPPHMDQQWRQELGPYHENRQAWHRRMNDSEWRDLKMCEGRI